MQAHGPRQHARRQAKRKFDCHTVECGKCAVSCVCGNGADLWRAFKDRATLTLRRQVPAWRQRWRYQHSARRRLQPGIGPIRATALEASRDDSHFRTRRMIMRTDERHVARLVARRRIAGKSELKPEFEQPQRLARSQPARLVTATEPTLSTHRDGYFAYAKARTVSPRWGVEAGFKCAWSHTEAG